MKSLSTAKFLAVAGLAVAAFGASTAANARSDVVLSIGLQGAPYYSQPAPVYVQPRPVYYESQPSYYQQQPSYYEPQPVYTQPAPVYVVEPRAYWSQGIEYIYVDGRSWRMAEWRQHYYRQHHREWDRNQYGSHHRTGHWN